MRGEVLALPGLIKGAWKGRGFGSQFLNFVAQADALFHVVDASGSIDPDGKIAHAGMGNPILDVYDIEKSLFSGSRYLSTGHYNGSANDLSNREATTRLSPKSWLE